MEIGSMEEESNVKNELICLQFAEKQYIATDRELSIQTVYATLTKEIYPSLTMRTFLLY